MGARMDALSDRERAPATKRLSDRRGAFDFRHSFDPPGVHTPTRLIPRRGNGVARLIASRRAIRSNLNRVAFATGGNPRSDPHTGAALSWSSVGYKLHGSLQCGGKPDIAMKLVECLQRFAFPQRPDHAFGAAFGRTIAHHRNSWINGSYQHGVVA